MARKSIRLSAVEHATLVAIYLAFRIPSDQFKVRPQAKALFLSTWSVATSRSDVWEDLIHYIITKRKSKQWVCLGDDYLPLPDPPEDFLTPSEWDHLDAAYAAVMLSRNLGSDNLTYCPALASELAREFARLSGRTFDSSTVMALVVARRKRGDLVRLHPVNPNDEDLGFSDIDEIAS